LAAAAQEGHRQVPAGQTGIILYSAQLHLLVVVLADQILFQVAHTTVHLAALAAAAAPLLTVVVLAALELLVRDMRAEVQADQQHLATMRLAQVAGVLEPLAVAHLLAPPQMAATASLPQSRVPQ